MLLKTWLVFVPKTFKLLAIYISKQYNPTGVSLLHLLLKTLHINYMHLGAWGAQMYFGPSLVSFQQL